MASLGWRGNYSDLTYPATLQKAPAGKYVLQRGSVQGCTDLEQQYVRTRHTYVKCVRIRTLGTSPRVRNGQTDRLQIAAVAGTYSQGVRTGSVRGCTDPEGQQLRTART